MSKKKEREERGENRGERSKERKGRNKRERTGKRKERNTLIFSYNALNRLYLRWKNT